MNNVKIEISIITICFNYENGIESTILSVINQTYKNIQYIIVDGGSTDGTLDIINKYKDNIDVFVSEPDDGIFDAMNKGLKYATGTWVNFMNAGDTFYEFDTLRKIFEFSDYSNSGVIYGSKFWAGKIYQPTKLSTLKYGGLMACHQSILYNRKICGEELYYKTKHKHYGDIELTRRLYIKKITFQKVDTVIANFEGEGFSSNISSAARIAKFDYLIANYGFLGFVYGLIGKISFLITRSLK